MIDLSVRGMGAVSGLGGTWPETWAAVLNGRRHIRDFQCSIERGATSTLVSAIDGTDRDLADLRFVEGAAARLAMAAAHEAMNPSEERSRLAVFGGSTHGESDILFDLAKHDRLNGDAETTLVRWRSLIEDSLAARMLALDRTGSGCWLYSSCTSSMHALVLAALELQDVESNSEAALVLGVDALSVLGVLGFVRIGASTATQCLPFHLCRNGTVVGEGAAAIVLDKPGVAAKSQMCRLVGFGMNCEAAHPTRPVEGGAGIETAISQALNRARAQPEDVAGIVLHGTGTPHNDIAEADALRRLFVAMPPATSVKGAIGHTMGAAGIFNCLFGIQACYERILPPTATDGSAILDGIDLVIKKPRRLRRDGAILVLCSGFGGNNVAAIFSK